MTRHFRQTMAIRKGNPLSGEELAAEADPTIMDVRLAKRRANGDLPRLRGAFNAELIDPRLDPGPTPDA